MNENTEKLVRELTEKLGTTTEHIYGVLVNQAPIVAVTDTITTVFMIAILWAAYSLVKRKTTEPPVSDDNPYPNAEWEIEGAIFAWGAVVFYGLLVAIVTCSTISTVITIALNPEYWALKQIFP